ncbi:MAG: CHAT domain-containing protein [Planctomycetota bacterium]
MLNHLTARIPSQTQVLLVFGLIIMGPSRPSQAEEEPSAADWDRRARAALVSGDAATARSLADRWVATALDDGPNYPTWFNGVDFIAALHSTFGDFDEALNAIQRHRRTLNGFDSVPRWLETTLDVIDSKLVMTSQADPEERAQWVALETRLEQRFSEDIFADLDRVLSIEAGWFGEDSVAVAITRCRIARALLDEDERNASDLRRVKEEIDKAEASFKAVHGPGYATATAHGPTVSLLRGRWHLARDEHAAAIAAFDECQSAREKLKDTYGVADLVDWKAVACQEKEDWATSERLLRDAIEGYLQTDGRDSLPDSRTRRAIALNQLERYDEAIAELLEVPTDVQRNMIGWLSPLTDTIMGNSYWGKGDYEIAAQHYIRAAVGYFDEQLIEEPLLRLIDAADCYAELGDPLTAQMLYQQVMSRAVLHAPDMDLTHCRDAHAQQVELASSLKEVDPETYRTVTLIKDEEETYVVTRPTQIKSGTQVLAELKQGDYVYRTGQQGDWIQVRFRGKNGFVRSATVTSLWDQLSDAAYDRLDKLALQNPTLSQTYDRWYREDDLIWERYDAGDLEGALRKAQEALRLSQAMGEVASFLTLTNLGNVVDIREELGHDPLDYKNEMILLMGAYQQHFGIETIETAFEDIRTGEMFSTEGNEFDALRLYQRALKAFASVFGPEHSRTRFVATQIAVSQYYLGLFDQARAILRKNIELERKRGNDLSILVSDAHQYLAEIELEDNNFAQAYAEAHQSLSIVHRNGIRDANLLRPVIATLAAIEVWGGDSAGSMRRLKQLQLDRLQQEAEGDDMVEYQTALGFMVADPDVAVPWIKRFQDRVAEAHGDEHILANDIDFLNAINQLQQGKVKKSVRGLDRVRRRAYDHFHDVLADVPVPQQIAFLKMNDQPNLHQGLSLAYVDPRPEVLQQQASWLINCKALSEQIHGQQIGLIKQLKTPAQAQAFAQWRLMRRQLSLAGNPRNRVQQVATFRADVEAANAKRLQILGPAFAERLREVDQDWTELESFTDTLKENEVYVDFLRLTPLQSLLEGKSQLESFEFAEPVYAAWTVRRDGSVSFHHLGDAERIDRVLAETRRVINEAVFDIPIDGEAAAEAKLRPLLRELTGLIWDPLRAQTESADRLIISPDSGLWLVPWGALIKETAEDSEQPRYLIEDHAIELVVAGRDRLRPAVAAPQNPPVIVADPAFDAEVDSLQPQSAQPTLTRSPLADLQFQRVQRLPATRLEAVSIKPRLASIAGQEPVVKLDDEAVEGFLKRTRAPHTLVLSTHGFFLPAGEPSPLLERFSRQLLQLRSVAPAEKPKLSSVSSSGGSDQKPLSVFALQRCGLLLAGCNDSANATASLDDGILTGFEILQLDLRGTKLVVLSACETGLGDISEGEGVAGLRMAFQLAGAPTVLSSLWSVEDLQTAKLMTLFFAALEQSGSPAEALMSAQRQVIANRRARGGAAHPMLWAAFSVTARGTDPTP